jgi:hypothetical protein
MEQAEPHRELMSAAIERDGEAQRAVLAGEHDVARSAFTQAAALYRRSWEAAPPGSYGRLVGMLKAAILAGGGRPEANYVRSALADVAGDSPTAAYAVALAALRLGDDAAARDAAAHMRGGSDAFDRTAEAIVALADRDRARYHSALEAIVVDFESREEHLTGVPIADTAVMLERLATPRDMTAGVPSPLLP